jgi:glycosyltransferase involved in cell wall biosynthesis
MYNNVTMVLTSCNRLDLLEITINSIPKETLDKIPKKILIDDSADVQCFSELEKQKESGYLQNWTLLFNQEKLGQAGSIDRAYAEVETEYVFHCEDDWYFTNGDFIDRSLKILDKYDNVLQVTFREGEPHKSADEIYESGQDHAFKVWIPGWQGYPGFTYNPNIFRISAYQEVKPICGVSERDVGFKYVSMGWHTVVLENRSVRHIGDGRHVQNYVV